MPGVFDHDPRGGSNGGPRNSDLIPPMVTARGANGETSQVNPPIKPKPMWVKVQSTYAYPGINGFIMEAAKRAGFGESNEEASLLNKLLNDYFIKRVNDAVSHASRLTDPVQIEADLDRAYKMKAVLAIAATAIQDAIDHRIKSTEPPTPEITDASTSDLCTGQPKLKRGKLRKPPG